MTAYTPNSESTAKSRVTQIFQFLKAFYALRTKTILQVADQPWTQWISDIPDYAGVWVATESDLQHWLESPPDAVEDNSGTDEDQGDSTETNYDVLFRIRRPVLHRVRGSPHQPMFPLHRPCPRVMHTALDAG